MTHKYKSNAWMNFFLSVTVYNNRKKNVQSQSAKPGWPKKVVYKHYTEQKQEKLHMENNKRRNTIHPLPCFANCQP